MTNNIAIAGITGRMGRAILNAVIHSDNSKAVLGTVRQGSKFAGSSLEAVQSDAKGGVIKESLIGAEQRFDVLIDFTTPELTLLNLEHCVNIQKAMVIGTTGFSESQLETLQSYAQNIPVCVAANFSAGIVVMQDLVAKAAIALQGRADIEIIEAHHRNKVDAPSGTALALGHTIAGATNTELKDRAVYSRFGITGARKEDEIGFSVIRGGDTVGEHTVQFVTEGERLEITHRAFNRQAFAEGAVQAAQWLMNQQPDLYDMHDVLGL